MASKQIQEDLVEEIVRRYKETLIALAKYRRTWHSVSLRRTLYIRRISEADTMAMDMSDEENE